MASYQTIRKLSDGAAADVFLARGEGSTEPVILELMRPQLTAHGDLVNQFLGEARLRSQLEHPNLAKRVRGGKTRDGRYYVVTEPIRGESLRSHLKAQGALTASEVFELTVPLCRALAYLHGRGVVHKNLTAANVFLPGGLKAMQPKLFDASLALLRGGRVTTPKHGVCVVEAAYMAPERVGGQRADARSDIYSLGVLMHEALTGRIPLRDGPPLPPEQGALGEVIARATARNPAARYETADAMRDDLMERCRHTLVLETDAIEHSPKTRETLGAYELLETLGEGAMGTVYRARHQKLGREVALKVMRADAATNPRLVKRFRDEARAVNRINHPHIVEVVDFCDDEPETGRVYCVMELLRGCTLETLLESETLSVERTLKIGQQVCDALSAAHAVNVIHRDIKPANIFLVDPGEADSVKLVDFGVAKLRSIAGDPSGVHTMQGALLGTITYMAPEQAAGEEVDPRSDLYALGTTLYRMLSGHLPFGGPSFTQFALQIVNDPPAPLPLKTSNHELIPPALRALVMRCLEKDRAKRPASASELQRALRQVASRTRRTRGLRHALLAAAALLAAVTVSAAVLQKTGVLARWGFQAPPASAPVQREPGRGSSAPLPAVAAAPAPQPTAVAAEPEHPAPKKVRPTRRHRH